MKKNKTQNKKKVRNASIKTKIIGTIVPIIAILVIIMIVLAYTISSRTIRNNAEELLNSSISYQSKSIVAWLEENPNGLYIADTEGNVMKAAGSQRTFQDVLNETWYQEGLSRVNMHYGSAYQSADGTSQVSASAIINDNSDNIRVISGDVSLERIIGKTRLFQLRIRRKPHWFRIHQWDRLGAGIICAA